MDKLETMRVFSAVAEAQSFVGASKKLGLSAPAVTRHIAQLENNLRVKLFTRSTRHVRLTDVGAEYLSQVKTILEQILLAEESVTLNQEEPRGELVLTAPVVFGLNFVTPIVVEYLQRFPEANVRSVYRDSISNLLLEDLDVAVRIGELKDSGLFAVKVGTVRATLCASPEYIAANGEPSTPEDLVNHTIIHASSTEHNALWKFTTEKGSTDINLKPRLFCSHNTSAIEASVTGFGIVRLLSYQVAEHIHSGQLVRLLPDFEQATLPVHLVYADGRHATAKTRRFVEMAVESLRSNPILSP